MCEIELSRTEQTIAKLTTHTPGETVIENNVPPTCSSEGSYDEVVYCSVCGVELSRDTVTVPVDADAHVWADWTETVAPTCTEAGEKERVCTLCSQNQIAPVEALGHNWTAWQTMVAPTVEEPGLESRICVRCHESETREIPRLEGVKDRQVQFVPIDDMYFVVHLDDADYSIHSKTAKAIYWYKNVDLSFEVVTGIGWKHDGYEVRVNGQKLEANPDGRFTLPGGTDYAQINVYPTSVGASAAVTDGVCKYCGKVHPSHLWGRIVALFHLLLYFFKNAFGI